MNCEGYLIIMLIPVDLINRKSELDFQMASSSLMTVIGQTHFTQISNGYITENTAENPRFIINH